MKTILKVMTSILVLMIITSIIPISTFAAEETNESIGIDNVEIWDGSVASAFGGGDGTESNPYIISNGAELAYFSKRVVNGSFSGKHFRMTKNIVLNDYSDWNSWNKSSGPSNILTPMYHEGSNSSLYNCIFDGGGYTILGYYSKEGGLFSIMKNFTLKNLNLEASYIYSKNSTGAFMGSVWGCHLSNLHSSATVETEYSAAGIISCAYEGTTISNCSNSGHILAKDYAAGIAGTFKDCTSTLYQCVNKGEVISTRKRAGGIVGYWGDWYNGTVSIKNCINYGHIKGVNEVGGIFAYLKKGSYGYATYYLKNCENYGLVEGNTSVGGIGGQVVDGGTCKISENANFGEVRGQSKVGGILGDPNSYAEIRNCYNTERVLGNTYVGGICGYSSGCSMYTSFSMGEVIGNSNCGMLGGLKSSQTNCYYLESENGDISIGQPLSIYQFAQKNSFNGFDFNSIWKMNVRYGRPELVLTGMPSQSQLAVSDTEVDQYIIEQVKKYTSENLDSNTQYNAIINANISGEVKLKLLNELFKNDGFTDAKEGIAYLKDTSTHRNDYNFLTNNNVYCAYNYYEWLYSDGYGTLARGLLYADGLIFNGELMSFVDVNTYTDNNYPGVKKNKELLRTFLESNCDEVLGGVKETADFFSDLTELNGWSDSDPDAEINALMDNVLQARTKEELKAAQKNFADRIAAEAQNSQSKKLQLNGRKISEALGYSAAIISFAGATTDNILGILNLEQEIAKYTYFKDFLTEIASCMYASGEMRMAANSLLGDIKTGYFNRVVSLLGNVFTLEMGIINVKVDLLKTMFGAGGALAGEFITTLSLATFISNIVIDTGDFVKQVAYTQGYAELSAIYSKKLQQDKIDFKTNPNAENAWQFFRDYTMLWSLRYKGEEQYLEMNSPKMFIFGKVKTSNYTKKQDVVQDNLNLLNQKKFEFAEQYTVPANVMYSAKAVINCPVDVYVYASDGTLVAKLTDGVESDVINEYGRFAVIKQSYSGEYSKVIASNGTDTLNIKTVANSLGLIDYDFASLNEDGAVIAYSINNIACEKNSVMQTNLSSSAYTLDIDGNGEVDVNGEMNPDLGGHIPVQSIISDASDCVLKTGQKKLIKATVSPSNASIQTLDWFTDNEDVVSVKNGVVTALDKGIARVYAKAIDNEDVLFSIKVQVVRRDLLIGDVTLDDFISIADATYIQMYLAEYMELSKDEMNAADANGDGVVNINDVTYIQMFLADISDPLSVVGKRENTYVDTQYTVFGNFETNWDPGYETGYHMNCMTDYGEFGEYIYTFEALPAGHYQFGITDGTCALRTDINTISDVIPSGYYSYIGRNGELNSQYMEFVITDDADVTVKFDERTSTCTVSVTNTNDDYWWSTGDENTLYSVNPFASFGDCGEKTAYALYPDGRMVIFGRGTISDGCPFENQKHSITAVMIKSGVTSIGDSLFANAGNLASVTLSPNIETIGNSAFAFTKIEQIDIPKTVNTIGKFVFKGCDRLSSIIVDENNDDYFSDNGVLYDKKTHSLIAYPANFPETEYELIGNCSAMEEGALNQSKTIHTLTIPQSVLRIEDNVFSGCESLETIDFLGPKHIWNKIDISENSGLTSNVSIDYHFYKRQYKAIGNLSNPCQWEDNQEYSFSYKSDDGDFGIYELEIDNLNSGHYHFRIEDGNTSVPVDFYLTKSTKLCIQYSENGDSISFTTVIPDCAYVVAQEEGSVMDTYECGDSAYYTMYDSGLLILSGQGELWYVPMYSDVKKVVILDGITDITSYAFYYGEMLEEVYLSSTVSGVTSECFYECNNLRNIVVDSENYTLSVENSVLFDKNKTTLICYPAKKTDVSYSIPEGITTIGSGAFSSCENLTKITLPNSLAEFNANCIKNCNALTAVKLKESNANWIEENGVLYDVQKETLILYPAGKQEQTFVLPNTVQTINSYSIKSSSLNKLIIPKSVVTIEGYAFSECTALTEIDYYGTEEEWLAIAKNDNQNSVLTRITINYLPQNE